MAYSIEEIVEFELNEERRRTREEAKRKWRQRRNKIVGTVAAFFITATSYVVGDKLVQNARAKRLAGFGSEYSQIMSDKSDNGDCITAQQKLESLLPRLNDESADMFKPLQDSARQAAANNKSCFEEQSANKKLSEYQAQFKNIQESRESFTDLKPKVNALYRTVEGELVPLFEKYRTPKEIQTIVGTRTVNESAADEFAKEVKQYLNGKVIPGAEREELEKKIYGYTTRLQEIKTIEDPFQAQAKATRLESDLLSENNAQFNRLYKEVSAYETNTLQPEIGRLNAAAAERRRKQAAQEEEARIAKARQDELDRQAKEARDAEAARQASERKAALAKQKEDAIKRKKEDDQRRAIEREKSSWPSILKSKFVKPDIQLVTQQNNLYNKTASREIKIRGNVDATKVIPLDDGYVISGKVSEGSTSGAFVTRLDERGLPTWTRFYPEYRQINGVYLTQANDGSLGVLIDGNFNGERIDVLNKIDPKGNHVWEYRVDEPTKNDALSLIMPTLDGGFILGGRDIISETHAKVYLPNDPDILVRKIDSRGSSPWRAAVHSIKDKIYNSTDEKPNDIIQTPEGFFFVAGKRTLPSSGDDPLLIKMSGSGDWVWSYSKSDPGNEEANKVMPAKDGGAYLVTKTDQYNKSGITKLDENGEEKWKNLYNFDIRNAFKSREGNIIAVGQKGGFNVISKIDPDTGDTLWSRGGSRFMDKYDCLLENSDGGYTLATTKGNRIYILTIDRNGNIKNEEN